MEKFIFRRAIKADYNAVNSMTKELFEYHQNIAPKIFGNAEFQNYDMQDFISETTDDDKAWFVAQCGDEVVGMVLCYITANRFDNIYCFVDCLFVRSAFRCRGVASGLMRNVEEFAKLNGVNSIQLNVWTQNESGAKFYEKSGFRAISSTLEKEI